MEKTIQRWLGTMFGAIVGLTCGCLSEMLFPKQPYHNIFLFVSTAVVVFVALTFAGSYRIEGGKRLIEQYSYATCLFCLTLGVALMPFAGDSENRYKAGLFRVMNVTIGCCLGAAGSVLLWPRPTLKVLHQKTAQQVILAGQASEAVLLTAVDAFSGRRAVSLLSQQLLQSRRSTILGQAKSLRRLLSDESNNADLALEKYEEAIGGWMQSKALFPLLRYDPFAVFGRKLPCCKQTTQELEQEENEQDTDIATILARALRIQTTVIVLDGMIRYDAVYEFNEEQLQLFATTGILIRRLLTLPLAPPSQTATTLQGLFGQFEALRLSTRRAAASFLDDPHLHNDKEEDEEALLDFRSRLLRGAPSTRMDDNKGRGLPLYTSCSIHSNRLLFLQLVEQLVLRALRLYHALADTEMHEKLTGSASASTSAPME
jgi:hypothetical protein